MHSAANTFSREITRHYDSYFEDYGLTTSYVELLLILDKHDSLSQKRIAGEMNLAPSTITRFISKLEKQGFLIKEREGKTVTVSITKNKTDEIKALKKLFLKADKNLCEILGEQFVETTKKLLEHGFNELSTE